MNTPNYFMISVLKLIEALILCFNGHIYQWNDT